MTVYLSDGKWTFFMAVDHQGRWFIMRHKDGITPMDRCNELKERFGRDTFPVRVHVHRVDVINWFNDKIEHLVNAHDYTEEDATKILGVSLF